MNRPNVEWLPADSAPEGVVFALRLTDDALAPAGTVVYADRERLENGDMGVFLLKGQALCRQYYRDALGMVYLFSPDRNRAEEDLVLPPSRRQELVCLGRLMLPRRPIPGRD